MAITQVGSVTTNSTGAGGAGTTITCNIPTGFRVGDLLLWQIVVQNISNPATNPTGFSLWQQGSTTGLSSSVYYKFADGTESSPLTSQTLPSARLATLMTCYRGVAGVVHDVAATSTTGTTATTFGAITPVTPGALVVALGAEQFASGTPAGTLSTSNLSGLASVATTAAAAANVLAGIGTFAWSSGAFTPNMSNSAATARTLGIRGALRPDPGFELLTPTPRYF